MKSDDNGTMRLSVIFGGMAPRLSRQLAGCGIPHRHVTLAQRCADAVVLLRVQGLLSDAAVKRAHSKIVDQLAQQAKRGNVKEDA